MGMPKNPGAIDLMLNIPGEDSSSMYDFMKPLLMDEESRNVFKMPAEYMFRNIPDAGKRDDYIGYTIDFYIKRAARAGRFNVFIRDRHDATSSHSTLDIQPRLAKTGLDYPCRICYRSKVFWQAARGTANRYS